MRIFDRSLYMCMPHNIKTGKLRVDNRHQDPVILCSTTGQIQSITTHYQFRITRENVKVPRPEVIIS